MRKLASLFFVLVCLAGCGGTAPGNYIGDTPFEGNWAGFWQTPNQVQSGQIEEVVINNRAGVSGLFQDSSPQRAWNLNRKDE